MGLAQTIEYFRREEEALFSGEALVTRATGEEGAFDPMTGEITAPEPDTIYEGPAQYRPNTGEGGDVTSGEREIRLRGGRAKFPHDTPLKADDAVTWTASQHDPDLVGKVFRITDVLRDDWQIVRVALLEEVTGGP